MLRFSSSRLGQRSLSLLFLLLIACGVSQAAPLQASDTSELNGRVVLVLPFENHSGQADLSWIGESFPDTLNQRLNSSGFLTISSDDRKYALDHLGLPTDFRPTRATTIRIAQTLDASYVIIGSYNVSQGHITAQAQIVEVNHLSMSTPIEDSNMLVRLFDVQNDLAWKIARQIDPKFNVAQQTFLAASGQVSLSAFESYIRGISASTPQERVQRLKVAVQLSPGYTAALLALGKAQFTERDFDQAAATLGRVPRSDRRALEANFYLGLAQFNSGRYADAEKAFAFVATRLPLPEVINNEAVASSRQGHNAIALFERVVAADPNDADFHYNLAVSLARHGDYARAQSEADQVMHLRPKDTEAPQLKSLIAAGRPPEQILPADAHTTTAPAVATTRPSTFEPVERIRRTYSEASFRQAAFQLDQMRAARMATLPSSEQVAQYVQLGRDYLAQGLVPEAEQQFQSALGINGSSAEARAGIAEVREQSGDRIAARSEAQASLQLHPNPRAYLVLARLDLHDNQNQSCASNIAQALKLDPRNTAALGMKQALASRGQSLP
ncbi:MAG: tetratricopeptide repeat protein [Edaphobacter sp.]|uniref:tetratricopeptide repeat protein n=1 Tax=Edaphobacter sp. TaxID=1934404 RepID=UPI002389149A|nr:tetratricopeptide repeat protein [Edaphobacter sp.]MDE1177316.1 tetratricopeptide repeat protein [Edaphobacter sp.]